MKNVLKWELNFLLQIILCNFFRWLLAVILINSQGRNGWNIWRPTLKCIFCFVYKKIILSIYKASHFLTAFPVSVIYPHDNFLTGFLILGGSCFLEQTWETRTFLIWSHTRSEIWALIPKCQQTVCDSVLVNICHPVCDIVSGHSWPDT